MYLLRLFSHKLALSYPLVRQGTLDAAPFPILISKVGTSQVILKHGIAQDHYGCKQMQNKAEKKLPTSNTYNPTYGLENKCELRL